MEALAAYLDAKYPIGNFNKQDFYSPEEIQSLIHIIETAPAKYNVLVKNLSEADLTKTYRDGSWNVRQLIHHVADIQLLHFLRMKKALTEPDYKDVTLILMDEWVKTPDGIRAPIEDSLVMFEGITKRHVYLLKSLTDENLKIEYFHPVRKYIINQAQALAMTAWHVQHHYAHIEVAIKKND